MAYQLVYQDELLNWGVAQLRDLPWRRTRDPWAVLVSEVMLQQTQVERVIPRWFSFLEAFPTPAACACAPLGDVLRLWQGLGYPRRARSLHGAAQAIVELGEFPNSLAGLLALAGVGSYTARAVLAFAFEADAAVVDTNIARVFARLAGERLTARQVQAAADAALPHGDAWAWNQCLMDLGAALCRPLAPRCGECPLRPGCAWNGGADDRHDPALGSAGVSGRQSRFAGSDRQGRGRLMNVLGLGPVQGDHLPAAMGWPGQQERATRVAATLVADRLVVHEADVYRLP